MDRDEENLLNALSKLNLDNDDKGGKREHVSGCPSRRDEEKYELTKVAHITKLCASFARATTLLTSLGQIDGAQCGTVLESLVA